jgi:hypothetical protein
LFLGPIVHVNILFLKYTVPKTRQISESIGEQVLFRTLRSRDHDVVVVLVGRKINLGYWEFGMGRKWGGVEKGEVSSRVT